MCSAASTHKKAAPCLPLARQGRIDADTDAALSFGMSNGSGFDADVILSGGGLVGQTLALALDQAGVSVIVIDA
ncbi:MAG: hypothetical protein SH849_07065, partial [Terricaulis sp.]|nr:hypothetical protein [Terricaulis sp.]